MNRPIHLIRLAREGWDHRGWYEEAWQAILGWCRQHYLDPYRYIDILAVTSPRMAVTRNVRVTNQYMLSEVLPKDVTRSTRAAMAHYEETGVIRGQKTEAFSAALKGDWDSIVLDTWMARALGVPQEMFTRKGVHASACRRIRYVAHLMDIRPAECQAAIWSGICLRHGRVNVPCIKSVIEGENQ